MVRNQLPAQMVKKSNSSFLDVVSGIRMICREFYIYKQKRFFSFIVQIYFDRCYFSSDEQTETFTNYQKSLFDP